MKMAKKTLEERLNAKLVLDEKTGCLEWTGPVNYKGIGKLRVSGGRQIPVHKVAWELKYGEMETGTIKGWCV